MSKNTKLVWRYCLYFDMRGALEAGTTGHPQEEMKKLAEELKFKILRYEPVPIGDCWLFMIEADNPWLGKKFPVWLFHQGYEYHNVTK